jgi:hypothetical protein
MARTIMEGIERTSKMLRTNECVYTSVHGGLSDSDRDNLDLTVSKFIKDCGDRIDELNSLVAAGKRNASEMAHLKVVSGTIDFPIPQLSPPSIRYSTS